MEATTDSVWKRRFERERLLRKEAEKLLEAKSLELYQTQQSLEQKFQELETLNAQLLTAEEELRQNIEELKSIQEEREKAFQSVERLNHELEQKVTQRTEEINIEKNKVLNSINYARRIQLAMLTYEESVTKKLPAHFVLYKPKDIVSGDFYWFSNKFRGKTFMAAVDCTGHGVPGAFMSLIGNHLLREIVNISSVLSVDTILTQLDQGIQKALKQKTTSNNDGMDISLIMIDEEDRTIEFAGANQYMVLIQEGEMQIAKGCKQGIGGWRHPEPPIFKKQVFPIVDNTYLYLFSDGFQDQFGGPNGRKFMRKHFRNLLFDIHQTPFDTQKQLLDDTLTNWMQEGNTQQTDDILVIGVHLSFNDPLFR